MRVTRRAVPVLLVLVATTINAPQSLASMPPAQTVALSYAGQSQQCFGGANLTDPVNVIFDNTLAGGAATQVEQEAGWTNTGDNNDGPLYLKVRDTATSTSPDVCNPAFNGRYKHEPGTSAGNIDHIRMWKTFGPEHENMTVGTAHEEAVTTNSGCASKVKTYTPVVNGFDLAREALRSHLQNNYATTLITWGNSNPLTQCDGTNRHSDGWVLYTTPVGIYSSLETIRPDTSAASNVMPSLPINFSLHAERNEYESFQVAINGGTAATGRTNVDVSMASPFTEPGGATIPAADTTIYREAYYHVGPVGSATQPSDSSNAVGDWPDALIPKVDYLYNETRNAFPVSSLPSADSNDSQVTAWIDVFVPKTQTAGVYTGTVRVSDASGVVADTPVTLNVSAGPPLPSTPSLKSIYPFRSAAGCGSVPDCSSVNGGFYGYTPQDWTFRAMIAKVGLENRVSIANPATGTFGGGMGGQESPYNFQGQSDPEYARWKTYIAPFVNGTEAASAGNLFPGADSRLTSVQAGDTVGAKLTSYLLYATCQATTACVSGWKAMTSDPGNPAAAALANSLIYQPCDEPANNYAGNTWTDCQSNETSFDQQWGSLAVPKQINAQIATDWSALPQGSYADVITPVINDMDPGGFASKRTNYDSFLASGVSGFNPAGTSPNSLWLYTSCSSYQCAGVGPTQCPGSGQCWTGWPGNAIDLPGSEQRAIGWLAYEYNTTGIYYYDTGSLFDQAWTNQYQAGGNGDGTMFYPGAATAGGSGPAIGGTHGIPLESIRLKRTRDGVEDYEYMHMLSCPANAAPVTTLFGVPNTAAKNTNVSPDVYDSRRLALWNDLNTTGSLTCN